MIRVCLGYHRSGSSWTSRLIGDACSRLGLRFEVLHDASDIEDLGAWARARRVQVLS